MTNAEFIEVTTYIRKYCETILVYDRDATPGPWWNESFVIHAKGPEWTPESHSCIHPLMAQGLEDEDIANCHLAALYRNVTPPMANALLAMLDVFQLGPVSNSLIDARVWTEAVTRVIAAIHEILKETVYE